MMRYLKMPLWLLILALTAMSLTSCDPLSSVEYKIYNMTEDTVAVSFYKEIMTSPYQGYSIEENDSVTTDYNPTEGNDSILTAVLAPKQALSVSREWNGLYREERIVPAWKYIKSMTMGDREADPEVWGDESRWTMKTKGGGFGEGESRYYQLLLRPTNH